MVGPRRKTNAFAAPVIVAAALTVAGCSPARSHAEEMTRAINPPGSVVRFTEYDEMLTRDGTWACLSFYTKNEFGNVSNEQSSMFQLKPGQRAWAFQGIVPNPHALCMKDVKLLHGG